MSSFSNYKVPYPVDDRYAKKVAYFSMEFAIHQPLKMETAKEKRFCVAFAVAKQNEAPNFHCIDRFWQYPR